MDPQNRGLSVQMREDENALEVTEKGRELYMEGPLTAIPLSQIQVIGSNVMQ